MQKVTHKFANLADSMMCTVAESYFIYSRNFLGGLIIGARKNGEFFRSGILHSVENKFPPYPSPSGLQAKNVDWVDQSGWAWPRVQNGGRGHPAGAAKWLLRSPTTEP